MRCVSIVFLTVGLFGQAPTAPAPAKPAPAKPAAAKPAAAKPAPGAPKPAAAKPAAVKPAPEPPGPVRPDGVYATFDIVHGTEPLGKIVAKLFEKESPVTVKNFIDLATGRKQFTDPKTGQRVARPLYNGLTFHRVIPDFMIQGGDPMGSGMGGTDTIKDEFDLDLKFDRPGLLAMANAGPGTGSCQFFITERPTPHLNMRHTIFGEVIEGQQLVSQIARVPRDGADKPRTPLVMKRVSIERFPRPAAGAAPVKKAAPAKPAAAKPAPAAAPAKK